MSRRSARLLGVAEKKRRKTQSIIEILPGEIIQHILSFNGLGCHNAVSSTFNNCSNDNKRLYERNRISFVNEYKFNVDIDYDQNINRTHIVFADNHELTNKEKEMNYVESNDLVETINNCSSGDIILIKGEHKIPHRMVITKDCQLIGIDENSVLVITHWLVGHTTTVKLCIKNLKIIVDFHLLMCANSSLWMENVSMKHKAFVAGICFRQNTLLVAKNCHFSCFAFKRSSPALQISCCVRRAIIVGCEFSHYGNNNGYWLSSCVSIRNEYSLECNGTNVQCIGNVFDQKVLAPPIMTHVRSDDIIRSQLMILKFNIWKKKYKKYSSKVTVDYKNANIAC
eukprot:138897_1